MIFTINNLDTAGMKYVLASLVFNLNREKFTPVIIVNKKTGSSLEQQIEKKFDVHEIMLRFPGLLAFIPTLLRNVKKLKSLGSISHSFDYSSDWTEALTMKLAGIKYIAEKTNLSISSYRWKLKLGMANRIVCLSKAQSNQLSVYKHKVVLIPTGIDTRYFITAQAVERSSIGFHSNDVVLISVAHLVQVKGYEELIDAISILKEEFSNLKILCVGKGDEAYEQQLKNRCREKGVGNRITFLGNSENIAGLMKFADGKILATQNRGRREAFGAVLVEAMAAGLPVIATRSGGPEDIVIDGVTGWLVDGDGVDSLVTGIRKFMNDSGSWKAMGKKGQERAIKFYDEKLMVESYSKLYASFSSEK